MNWLPLKTQGDLDQILKNSADHPQVIFKHSTRCAISSTAKSRLEKSWEDFLPETPIYYLDLISYRELSNQIASQLGVRHESPQIIVLKNGSVIHHSSHLAISPQAILQDIES